MFDFPDIFFFFLFFFFFPSEKLKVFNLFFCDLKAPFRRRLHIKCLLSICTKGIFRFCVLAKLNPLRAYKLRILPRICPVSFSKDFFFATSHIDDWCRETPFQKVSWKSDENSGSSDFFPVFLKHIFPGEISGRFSRSRRRKIRLDFLFRTVSFFSENTNFLSIFKQNSKKLDFPGKIL